MALNDGFWSTVEPCSTKSDCISISIPDSLSSSSGGKLMSPISPFKWVWVSALAVCNAMAVLPCSGSKRLSSGRNLLLKIACSREGRQCSPDADRRVRSAPCSREQKACDQDQGGALCVARRRAHLLSCSCKGRRRVLESIIGLSNDDLVHLCASIVDLAMAMSRLTP